MSFTFKFFSYVYMYVNLIIKVLALKIHNCFYIFFISIGRELTGLPSKHLAKGRDRSVYFIWQGRNASLNERGAAALLTVELGNDRGPQVRIIKSNHGVCSL